MLFHQNFIPRRNSLSKNYCIHSTNKCCLISLKFYSSSSFSFFYTTCVLFHLFKFVKNFTPRRYITVYHTAQHTAFHRNSIHSILHLLPVNNHNHRSASPEYESLAASSFIVNQRGPI